MKSALKFILGCIVDPITGKLSSSRIAGLACVVFAGIVALKHPEAAATVAAFISGGAVALLSRTKSDSQGG